ncbi:2Fe-2S iron-sulfur cluster-binding protein [Desulfoferrobacter suflitae]|uniref:2Fe-2S iron-sulfur cluster-binding protein n=1 Tax=Desulfoferrobacter suflitae TaxID=2865782 RepID=UPI002164CDCF|nr:2Fe-2S iron-sulfur cluster-binding protein [Desulfoferrobacter suflitae]MCK8603542.1 2Fe-2S iron-sulfur cluster-binding protein [Desulfoferrobacter suflitae]
MKRLAGLPTLRVNSARAVSIEYDGKRFHGVEGDTVATLLYANGTRIFSRSLKYHRPRGLYSLDGQSSNTYVDVDDIPNVCAENTFVGNGMRVEPQNVLGTPEHDWMAFMDKLSWAMPAGFYYTIFHKPARLWPIAVRHIRKTAGLGSLSPDVELRGRFDQIYPAADVCIIGAGPAGMSAALAAAAQKLRVILLESRPWLGGYFDYRTRNHKPGMPLYLRGRQLADQLEQAPNIRIFKHTAVIGCYSNNLITAFQRGSEADCFAERYVQIRAESVVVATGCIERPLLFENNDRPGIMQIGCAHRLARTWGVLAGEQAVFSIGHDLGIEAAIDLHDLGLSIACVADVREDGCDPALPPQLEARNIPFYPGWVAAKAHGRKVLKKVTLTNLSGVCKQQFDCDTLVASAGLTPVTGPLALAGARLEYDAHTGYFLPTGIPQKMHAAGRMLGLEDPTAIELSGRLAGLRAVADCGMAVGATISGVEEELAKLPGPARGSKFVVAPVEGKKTFVCFDEDVTIQNIDQAMRLGFDVTELIKRFTSAGTGPGQGGIAGHNLPLYVALTHRSPDLHPRPTTVRPPLVPTLLATYAGTNHPMSKRTPVHASQVAAGGVMERLQPWQRARRFCADTTARAEIENVRTNVGMLDASTLGKFRIFGPDALKALQRVYVSDMARVSTGRMYYSAMCNEDGCVIDDGVATQIAENDYYFTTSTGRAGETSEWIRYHTRYDRWDFHIINLTDAYGVINLAGPNARKVLEKVVDGAVSNEAFPFLGFREFMVHGAIPVRAMRLGFVGELSFELHVPSSYMQSLWDILEEAGEEFAIWNFGLEAQNTLRLEKGHVILGSESEQRTTLHDIGLGFFWHRDKLEAQTVGAVALKQTENDTSRLKLVGFKMEEPAARAPRDGSPIVAERIRGYVCTARYSYALKEPVGMALVEGYLAKNATRLTIFEDDCKGELMKAKVVPMPFYDPTGKRMRM